MAEYEGDGSYRRLIANIYGARNGNFFQKYKENYILVLMNEHSAIFPSSLVRSGRYNFSYLANTSSEFSVWTNVTRNSGSGYSRLHITSIALQNSAERGQGFSVHCVAK